jgi:hypothetical protein
MMLTARKTSNLVQLLLSFCLPWMHILVCWNNQAPDRSAIWKTEKRPRHSIGLGNRRTIPGERILTMERFNAVFWNRAKLVAGGRPERAIRGTSIILIPRWLYLLAWAFHICATVPPGQGDEWKKRMSLINHGDRPRVRGMVISIWRVPFD